MSSPRFVDGLGVFYYEFVVFENCILGSFFYLLTNSLSAPSYVLLCCLNYFSEFDGVWFSKVDGVTEVSPRLRWDGGLVRSTRPTTRRHSWRLPHTYCQFILTFKTAQLSPTLTLLLMNIWTFTSTLIVLYSDIINRSNFYVFCSRPPTRSCALKRPKSVLKVTFYFFVWKENQTTHRQTDRHTYSYRQTEKHTVIQTDIQTDRQTDRQTHSLSLILPWTQLSKC